MILARLKHETALAHAQIEQQVDLFSRITSRAAYIGLLQRCWGFYVPVERALKQFADWQAYDFNIAARMKAAHIERDLRVLGMPAARITTLPQCTGVPRLDTFPAAVGCLYVLEGATLGGQIITQQVRQTLGLTPAAGCTFFNSYGTAIGPMWQAFRALAVRVATPANEALIVGAAQRTFAAFSLWLAESDSVQDRA